MTSPGAAGARPPAAGVGVESFTELADRILAAPARLGAVRLVAVDGGTGSGKTTFAGRLAGAIAEARRRVEVVHTDDLLDGWDDQFTFWARLEERVLGPLARGEPTRYPVYDWTARAFTVERELAVPDVLVLDGVSTGRRAGAASGTLMVFLDLEPSSRLRRALARDGGLGIERELRRWLAREIDWFAQDRTAARADVVVDAIADVGHHPEREYLRREVDRG